MMAVRKNEGMARQLSSPRMACAESPGFRILSIRSEVVKEGSDPLPLVSKFIQQITGFTSQDGRFVLFRFCSHACQVPSGPFQWHRRRAPTSVSGGGARQTFVGVRRLDEARKLLQRSLQRIKRIPPNGGALQRCRRLQTATFRECTLVAENILHSRRSGESRKRERTWFFYVSTPGVSHGQMTR